MHSLPSLPPQSALLEEQKSVMNKCGEERRRLAAEWAEYFTQQKLSKERAERELERAMHADSQREGTIISLTKVGPRAQDRAQPGALGIKGPWVTCPLSTLHISLIG